MEIKVPKRKIEMVNKLLNNDFIAQIVFLYQLEAIEVCEQYNMIFFFSKDNKNKNE